MRPVERLRVEEEIEASGMWRAARHTVCLGCDRYKVTNKAAICRRCTTGALVLALEDTNTHTQENQ